MGFEVESEFVRNLVFGWQMMMRELKDFVRNAFDMKFPCYLVHGIDGKER
jgi:hypothetical protein